MQIMDYLTDQYKVNIPGEVTWAHAVNTRERLQRFISDKNTMFIESDISLSSSGEIIVAHPPQEFSDLSLDELLLIIARSKKGLKLDFKDPSILKPVLASVQSYELTQPIILHADVLKGNSSKALMFNALEFINNCISNYPEGVISIGLATQTGIKRDPYTEDCIVEVMKLCKSLDNSIFCVRSNFLINAWEKLTPLLDNPRYYLTVWNIEPIDGDLQQWMKEHSDPNKTFYDLIDKNKEPFKLW